MSLVFSSGMLVKTESTSWLLLKKLESCFAISSAKANECITVYLLLVRNSIIDTGNIANLWVGVLIADKIGLNGK